MFVPDVGWLDMGDRQIGIQLDAVSQRAGVESVLPTSYRWWKLS